MKSNELITKGYRNQLMDMHKNGYGDSAGKWKHCINELIRVYQVKTLLDYGCGQAVLAKHLISGCDYRGYDPASVQANLRGIPNPAGLVICIDVLEHIEPELLGNVIFHLGILIQRVGFFVIAQRRAPQTLQDGRNAHLILEGPDWWRNKLHHILGGDFQITRHYGQTVKKDLVFLLERV